MIYQARLDRVMRETRHVLSFQTAKVEIIAAAFLLIIPTIFFRWGAAATHTPLSRWFATLVAYFFLHRITLINGDFNWILHVEILILARHSLAFATRVEVRWHTVFLLGERAVRWGTKIARCLHWHLAEQIVLSYGGVDWFVGLSRSQPGRELILGWKIAVPRSLGKCIAISSLCHQMFCIKISRRASHSETFGRRKSWEELLSIVLPQV